ITAIISMPLAFGCFVVTLPAVNFDFTVLDNPASCIAVGARVAGPLYWSMILDMFGYYLLIAPAALFLWYWLKSKNHALASLYTLCGLAYILIGAIGAGILAAVWPPLIRAYEQAAGAQRETLVTIFQTVTNLVYGGMWNILEVILAGVWWLGIGLLLRGEQRTLGMATIVLGLSCLLDGVGNILGMTSLASIGLYIYLLLAPIWALWLGIVLARGAGEVA
ncbi:MAG: hypothetical protein ACRENG_30475, partial [bacterium]